MGGTFETRRKAQLNFKMPEFSHNRTVVWTAHVNEMTDPKKAQYDMIIGTDLMSALKIQLDYSSKTIIWDNVSVSMKQRGTLSNRVNTETLYEMTKESSY